MLQGGENNNIPPTKPQINVVFGKQNENGTYYTNIELEFVPGINKLSQIERTTYTVNGGTETNITTLTNNIYTISVDGTYKIKVTSYDKEGNSSYIEKTFIKQSQS